MGKHRKTVADLAKEAGLDLDEALVTLWDAGFTKILGPSDAVSTGHLNRARRALGLVTRREIRDPEYWSALMGLTVPELRQLVTELGVAFSPAARRLPQNAVSRLKAEARRRGIDRVTGSSAKPTMEAAPQRARSTPLVWNPPGQARDVRFLTEDEVLGIHLALVSDFAGTPDPVDPPGVRSKDLLGSAVFRPQTSNGGVFKYSTIESSAAALLHSLIQNHPFHNGNKRTALVSMLVFLDENGFMPTCQEEELFRLVLQIAQHRIVGPGLTELADREVLSVAEWLVPRVRPVEVGEFLMPWRKLRRILTAFGCELSFPTGGNRINISRVVERKNIFGRRRTSTLHTQVFYGDEGRDVPKNTIKKVREDLQLDDLHGIDSAAFYDQTSTLPSDFIAEYRKTLVRLAKL